MSTFTQKELKRFYAIKPAGTHKGYGLDNLKSLRDYFFVKSKNQKKHKPQYKPTGFGVTRYNKKVSK